MLPFVEPWHLPLLLASDEFASANGPEPLDRLRVQKGVFLLQMAGPSAWRDAFPFKPYDWGPFSRQLAAQVDRLIENNLLYTERVAFHPYPRFRTTTEGDWVVEEIIP